MPVLCGDCLDMMKTFPDNHFSAVVTDPPYGLHFMGKDWDSFKPDRSKGAVSLPGQKGARYKIGSLDSVDSAPAIKAGTYDDRRNDEFQSFMIKVAREALRITKPGGHILMFGAPRRYHRQACAIEDAGWEVRDCLMWLFGSGFPKSHNFGRKLGGDWAGFGSALKPAYEPVLLGMKPLEGTFLQNAEKWGVAGINIDGCRIATQENLGNPEGGRWPANLVLDEGAAAMLDERSGISKSIASTRGCGKKIDKNCYGRGWKHSDNRYHSDSGGPSRFFYCPKVSTKERNAGLDRPCTHPTVKPLSLMRYLITLVSPPKDALILDPFAGSGTTLLAAKQLGIEAIGIEKIEQYALIARSRESSWTPS